MQTSLSGKASTVSLHRLTVLEAARELVLAVHVMNRLVDHHRPVHPAMACGPLSISAGSGVVPHPPGTVSSDGGVYQLALPFDFTWTTDFHRHY